MSDVTTEAFESFCDLIELTGGRTSALDILREYAVREDWARGRVARAGKSWATHLATFDGTVVQR